MYNNIKWLSSFELSSLELWMEIEVVIIVYHGMVRYTIRLVWAMRVRYKKWEVVIYTTAGRDNEIKLCLDWDFLYFNVGELSELQ